MEQSNLNMNKSLFPTSVVGSMPRSDFVKDLIATTAGEISNEEYESRMDAAVRYIIAWDASLALRQRDGFS